MFQQIILIGNLGNDPELRFTPSGVAVASFSLAVNRSWTGADGERKDKSTWFRVSVWNKQAETVTQYLHKGSKVMVVGEVEEARVFTGKDGTPRASLEVKSQSVRFMDSKKDSGDPTDNITVEGAPDIPF
jgi:single-strand DNA-binding protein